MDQKKKVAILVVGMHRSGTSAVTRVLHLVGCDLPRTLMGASPSNEAGHWESDSIVALNDEILESAGSAWDDWESFDPRWYVSSIADPFRDRAQTILKNEFGDSPLFVLKDPRICRLLPFWIDAVRTFGTNPLIVSPIRNPLDVALSLEVRDSIDPSIGYLLWLRHVLDAETDSRSIKRVYLRYEMLLSNPQATVDRLGNALDISWPHSDAVHVQAEIDKFLTFRLRHHATDDSALAANPRLSRWVVSSFNILEQWCYGKVGGEDITNIERIKSAFDAATPAFSQALVTSKRAVAARDEEIGELNNAVAARDEEIGELNNAVAARDEEIGELNNAVAARDEEIGELNNAVAARGRWIAELYASRSWRVTSPLRDAMQVIRSSATRVRANARQSARWIYHRAPLSPAFKLRIKGLLLTAVSSRAPRRAYRVLQPPPLAATEGDLGDQPQVSPLDDDFSTKHPIPPDGHWDLDSFREQGNYIRVIAAALSSPDDDGPVDKSEIDVEPVSTGPLVTIVLRTYAGRWPLTRIALESIKNQRYRPIEVIVAEDGVGELSDKIAALNAGDDRCRFKHVATGKKMGRSAAGNLGLDHADGDFIGFLDDDDYLLENHCGLLVARLLKRPEAGAVYAASKEVEALLEKGDMRLGKTGPSTIFFPFLSSPGELFHCNYFPIQAVLFRRTSRLSSDRLDENLDALEDWLFWMQMLIRCRVLLVGEVTSVFHVPPRLENQKRLESHFEAEEYLNIQRNTILEIYGISDMGLIDDHARHLMGKAFRRANLPFADKRKDGEGRESEKTARLMKYLGNESSPGPDPEPKFESKIAAFTSISLRYLPKALSWARSVKRHNPDWETHILLNDFVPDSASNWPGIDAVFPISHLGIPSLHSWIFSHNVVELCTATKPFYSQYLLDRGYEYVFYFDPDTYAYSDLEALVDEMAECEVLLTPHCTQKAIRDAEIHYNEISSLAHGVFNLGFVGFKRGKKAREVIDFWSRRLLRYCQDDHARGLFTDQKWFNHVPIFFEGIKVLKHEGCNTASWNISYRPISRRNNCWFSGNDPLIFFHFSGYDLGVPRTMFDVFGRFTKDLESLISEYDDTVKWFLRSYKEWKSEWIYSRYDNGVIISDVHREYYRKKFELQLMFPHPFYVKENSSYLKYVSHLGSSYIKEHTNSSKWLKRYY